MALKTYPHEAVNAEDMPYTHIDRAMESLKTALVKAMERGDYFTVRRCASAMIAVDPM